MGSDLGTIFLPLSSFYQSFLSSPLKSPLFSLSSELVHFTFVCDLIIARSSLLFHSWLLSLPLEHYYGTFTLLSYCCSFSPLIGLSSMLFLHYRLSFPSTCRISLSIRFMIFSSAQLWAVLINLTNNKKMCRPQKAVFFFFFIILYYIILLLLIFIVFFFKVE